MKICLTLTIVIFWLIAGCSSGGDVSEKTLQDNDVIIPHEASTIPQPGDLYDEDIARYMHDIIVEPIFNFYYCMGRVPETYDELLSSGFLFSIPRCPYNNEFYSEGDSTSPETPSIFNYYQLSNKTYGYEFIIMKNGTLSKYVDNWEDPDMWEKEALITGKADCADAKIQSFMNYMPVILRQFYNKYERLPLNPHELFADFMVIQSGWQKKPSGNYDDAYFEFGVDNIHNRYYVKYKYTHRAKLLYSWDLASLAPEASLLSIEEIQGLTRTFNYDETPPSDYLVMNQWFNFDTLESFYDLIK